jgi:hypothetical protein
MKKRPGRIRHWDPALDGLGDLYDMARDPILHPHLNFTYYYDAAGNLQSGRYVDGQPKRRLKFRR